MITLLVEMVLPWSHKKSILGTHTWEDGRGVAVRFIGVGANTKDCPRVPCVLSMTKWLSSIWLWNKSSFDFSKSKRKARVQRWRAIAQH